MANYTLKYPGLKIDSLLDTVNELQTNGYIFKGVATPATSPSSTTEKCAYIASEAGTYVGFGSIVLDEGLHILTYNGSAWSATTLSLEAIQSTASIATDDDLEISDESKNVLVAFSGGNIKVKNFDSSDLTPPMLKGKHMAIIGDSVSTYAGYLPTGWKTHYTSSNLSSVTLTYWWQLCDALKMTYNNCSYSTSRASGNSQATSVSGGDGECAGCSDVRIAALNRDGKTPDIVLIYLGINDWANNVPIGTFCNDGTLPAEGVINAFSDAYALMINKIRTNYPTCRIFCCTIFSNLARETTPPFRGGTSPYTSGNSLYSYNKAIRDVAYIMGCDVIDLAACGINNLSATTTTHDSKVHPNAAGFKLMYEKIVNEIQAKY